MGDPVTDGDVGARMAAIRDGLHDDFLLDEGEPVACGWRRSDGSMVQFNPMSAERAKAEAWETVYVFRLPPNGGPTDG